MEASKKKKTAAGADKAALKRKLTKLKELYVNDLIDIEDYKRDYQIYTAALNQIPETAQEAPPDFAAVRRLLDVDFKTISALAMAHLCCCPPESCAGNLF